MNIKDCPKCGKTNEVVVNGTAKGRVQRVFDNDGFSDNWDYFWFDMSQTVRCAKCNKIRKDLKCVNGVHIEEVYKPEMVTMSSRYGKIRDGRILR